MSESLLHGIVQGTLGTLIVFSVATWALALVKGTQFFRLGRQNAQFRKVFRSRGQGVSFERLAEEGPEARLALAGITTWEENEELAIADAHAAKEVLELRLKQQIQRERRLAEGGLIVLATIATTSPFVGLFGTVWGIMGALTQIGATGEAGIEVVAGPIGEALIATGVGIAVAVPAVIAFNAFVRRVKNGQSDLDDLALTLVSLALQGKLESAPRSERSRLASGTTLSRPSDVKEIAHRPKEASA